MKVAGYYMIPCIEGIYREMDTLHQLVRVVARSFYEDKQIVIFDTIVRETMIPDDVLIDRMQIVIRDLNRLLAHLMKDRLIKCETKQQPRADGKIITRNYFYIDYKQFVDIVKYRIYKMRHSVEEMIKKEMESKGYICPLCKTIFSSLDVSRLLNVRTGSFDCDICPDSELQAYDPMISNSGTKSTSGPHELHSRLMEQIRLIVELLKKADDITIPVFNPALWLEQNAAKYSLLTTELGNDDETGPQLAIAGSNSSDTQLSVSVELADDDSVKAAAAAAASSVSNPLPEWHMYSTITGEAIRTAGQSENSTKEQVKTINNDVIDITDDQDDIVNYYSQMAADEEPSESSKQVKQVKLIPETTDSSAITVMVAGKRIILDQITEDDKDKMTEEEYTQYYEIYMSTQ